MKDIFQELQNKAKKIALEIIDMYRKEPTNIKNIKIAEEFSTTFNYPMTFSQLQKLTKSMDSIVEGELSKKEAREKIQQIKKSLN